MDKKLRPDAKNCVQTQKVAKKAVPPSVKKPAPKAARQSEARAFSKVRKVLRQGAQGALRT